MNPSFLPFPGIFSLEGANGFAWVLITPLALWLRFWLFLTKVGLFLVFSFLSFFVQDLVFKNPPGKLSNSNL